MNSEMRDSANYQLRQLQTQIDDLQEELNEKSDRVKELEQEIVVLEEKNYNLETCLIETKNDR